MAWSAAEFTRRLFGDELYGAMCEVKGLFDPEGRLNPGKKVDAPRDDRTPARSGAPTVDARWPRTSLFRRTTGCAARRTGARRVGACRQFARRRGHDVPVVHGDARRARIPPAAAPTRWCARCRRPIRARRLATSGLHDMLDLCLECKACRSECPLSVDMAALKSELLAQHYARTGVPLRRTDIRPRPHDESRRRGTGATRQLGGRMDTAARVAPSAWQESTAAVRCRVFARETLPRWFARRRSVAHRTGAAAGPGRLPRRLVHKLHRARDRARRDRAAGAGGMAGGAGRRRLLRPRADLEGTAGRGKGAARRTRQAPGARGDRPACRSSAVSRRAC